MTSTSIISYHFIGVIEVSRKSIGVLDAPTTTSFGDGRGGVPRLPPLRAAYLGGRRRSLRRQIFYPPPGKNPKPSLPQTPLTYPTPPDNSFFRSNLTKLQPLPSPLTHSLPT